MRLYRVELTSARGKLFQFELTPSRIANSPYLVTDIDGIGPVSPGVKLSNITTGGGTYQGRRPVSRRITFNLELQVGYNGMDAEDIRDELYDLLDDTRSIYVEFLRNDPTLEERRGVNGYVSAFEVEIFNETPTAMIAIDCPAPYFSGWTGMMVSNPDTNPFTIMYDGSYTTGMLVQFTLNQAITRFTIGSKAFSLDNMDVQKSIPSGAKIVMETRTGLRDIYYLSPTDGSKVTLLPFITDDTVWPDLRSGSNSIQIRDGNSNLFPTSAYKNFSLTYYRRFWGL